MCISSENNDISMLCCNTKSQKEKQNEKTDQTAFISGLVYSAATRKPMNEVSN